MLLQNSAVLMRPAILVVILAAAIPLRGEESAILRELKDLARAEANSKPDQSPLEILDRHAADELRIVNERERKAWHHVSSRQQWEAFRDQRISALRASLGSFPEVPADLHVRVTGHLEGDGYKIENLVFESRPGLFVTANLYQPATPAPSMPGILICHSHHLPKSEGELQEMGISWATRGCMVLVMDVLGHGERRQHPFATEADYPAPFKVSRQDYYFRYNLGIQLQLIGQSLSGWIAWDLMRGVDLLLSRHADPKRIILLGAVASGGDLAAVTAALEPRISAAAIFNFGGPQPETRFPLAPNAEESFRYSGSGSWESTRNLPFSARDGFLPWVIVASVAPRPLVYGHEFSWDRDHDPVWTWLQQIYVFYNAPDNLIGVHGFGRVTLRPPQASHCNNLGPVQLKDIHPALQKWFAIPLPTSQSHAHHTSRELLCMTPALAKEVAPKHVYELATEVAQRSIAIAREKLAKRPQTERRAQLAAAWSKLLSDVEPPEHIASAQAPQVVGTITRQRITLQVGPELSIPILLLRKSNEPRARQGVVIAIAQEGHAAFLTHRTQVINDLLESGTTVYLADLRGTGVTDTRDRTSRSTDVSASWLMLGRPLLGQRLRDLRCVLQYLRGINTIDTTRIVLWADSFVPPNPPSQRTEVPHAIDDFPRHSEPAAGIIALLCGVFEKDIHAICIQGTISSYQSILEAPFCHIPHDITVPGVLGNSDTGDIADLLAAQAPRPIRISATVNGKNEPLSREHLESSFAPALNAYRALNAARGLQISIEDSDREASKWLQSHIARQ